MGLERNNGWERRGHDLVKGTQMPRPRDISSDPAVKPHKPHQGVVAPYRCNHPDCPVTTYDRDISSVTGSRDKLLLSSVRANLSVWGVENGYASPEHLLDDIQREAVDAFIRDELPGLLMKALDEDDQDVPDEWYGRPSTIANNIIAKVVEARKEVEQRAQTS